MKELQNRPKKFVLIDDDPTYRATMIRAAQKEGLELEVYDSILDIYATWMEYGPLNCKDRYDAAIIDFDLGSTTGVEIAGCLANLFGDISLVLVSERDRSDQDGKWPTSIVKFVKKSSGCGTVLREALRSSLHLPSDRQKSLE